MERFKLLSDNIENLLTRPFSDEDRWLQKHLRDSPKMIYELGALDRSIKDLRIELYSLNGQIRLDIADQLDSAMNSRQMLYEEFTGEKFNSCEPGSCPSINVSELRRKARLEYGEP